MNEAIEPRAPEWEIGSPDLFSHRVAGVRSDVTSIIRSETSSGDLRFMDEGIDLFAGGVWLASVWRSQKCLLEIACSQGVGTWRVLMHPLDPYWRTRILAWPSGDFDVEVRAAVASLRTGEPLPRIAADGSRNRSVPRWTNNAETSEP